MTGRQPRAGTTGETELGRGLLLAELGQYRRAAAALDEAELLAASSADSHLQDRCLRFREVVSASAHLAPVDQFDKLSRASLARAVDALRVVRPARVLDAGCGNGVGIELLAARYPETALVGIDRDLAGCEDLAGTRNLQLMEADLERPLTGVGPFDAVVCHAVLHLVENPPAVLAHLRAVTAAGGEITGACFTDAYYRDARQRLSAAGIDLVASPVAMSADDVAAALIQVGFEELDLAVDEVILEVPSEMESEYLSRIMGRRARRGDLKRLRTAVGPLWLDLRPLSFRAVTPA